MFASLPHSFCLPSQLTVHVYLLNSWVLLAFSTYRSSAHNSCLPLPPTCSVCLLNLQVLSTQFLLASPTNMSCLPPQPTVPTCLFNLKVLSRLSCLPLPPTCSVCFLSSQFLLSPHLSAYSSCLPSHPTGPAREGCHVCWSSVKHTSPSLAAIHRHSLLRGQCLTLHGAPHCSNQEALSILPNGSSPKRQLGPFEDLALP